MIHGSYRCDCPGIDLFHNISVRTSHLHRHALTVVPFTPSLWHGSVSLQRKDYGRSERGAFLLLDGSPLGKSSLAEAD